MGKKALKMHIFFVINSSMEWTSRQGGTAVGGKDRGGKLYKNGEKGHKNATLYAAPGKIEIHNVYPWMDIKVL